MAVLIAGKARFRTLFGASGMRTTALLLGILLALVAALGVTRAVFDDRAVPGLRVAGVHVGGLDRDGVRARLAAELATAWSASRVELRDGARTWTTTNGELGITVDLDAAVAAATAYGKAGDPRAQIGAWFAASRGADLPLVTRGAESDLPRRFVERLATEIDRPAVDGELGVVSDALVVRAPENGRELDQAQARVAIAAARTPGDRTIDLVVRPRHPAVDDAGFTAAATLVRSVTTPLEVSAGDRGLTEGPVGLAALLTIERKVADAGALPPVPQGAIAPSARYVYTASLSQERLKAWVDAVAENLDRPARNASYRVTSDGSLGVIPSQSGVKVDREALLALASRELVAGTPERRVLTPALVVDEPVFTTEQAQRHASGMVLLGAFETYFPPDHARWQNIATGAAQFNNQVVAPGEVFSFWRSLGPVEISRGYAYSGAIVDGMSRNDIIGGGLCQVSTTLFMAVAEAGYQIIERGQHDYFIDRYPLGLDAAVFWPGLDLRWRNDTPFPAMIRTSSSWSSVRFEVFSIPNGRQTVFGPAVETNIRDVAPGQRADPAFMPGARVLGRDVTRTRTVTEHGRVVHHDIFRSRYNPVWGGPAH